jgi:O-methyltransferase
MRNIIYGAGDFGTMLLQEIAGGGGPRLLRSNIDEVVAIVDANPKVQGLQMFGHTVTSPDVITGLDYDSVLISLVEEELKMSVFYKLAQIGVEFGKIKFRTPRFWVKSDFPRGYDPDPERIAVVRNFRYAGIPGNIAECGVFRGMFAKRLNRLFHGRKLYLFDTFEGFSKQSIIEADKREESEAFRDWVLDRFDKDLNDTCFSDTSPEFVMSQMPFPKNIVMKQGFVPNTFKDVDDTFAFVSLDMDIYEPTFEALKFFWYKMSVGGMLLLHDYIDVHLTGIKTAVQDFEAWLGYDVPKFVCADNRTLAIIKFSAHP